MTTTTANEEDVEETNEEKTEPKKTATKRDSPRRRNTGAVKKSASRGKSEPDDVLDADAEIDESQALLDPDSVQDDTQDPVDTKSELEKAEEDFKVFEPKVDPKRWCIGKPPQEPYAGDEDEYEFYIQRPLSHIQRGKFFGLVMRTIALSIKQGGGLELPFGDVLGTDGGSLQQRYQQFTQQDITDVTSFVTMMFTLASHADDFIVDCWLIMLQVPGTDRVWFRQVIDQRWDPDNEEWGITEKDTVELLERFFDQNYEEVRDFFVTDLARFGAKVAAKERLLRAKKAHSEASGSSKRSRS